MLLWQKKILDIWFQGFQLGHPIPPALFQKWWSSTPAFDSMLQENFHSTFISILNKEPETEKDYIAAFQLEGHEEVARGCLGSILLMDQISRNVFRKKKEAFSFDKHALFLSNYMQQKKWDQELNLIERIFAYMPFMHSELLSDQVKGISLFTSLSQQAQKDPNYESCRSLFNENVKFAQVHLDLIEKYGRFPHRNAILGRESTEEELEYLKNADTFGQ